MSNKMDLYCNPVPLPDLPPGMDRIYPGRCATGYTGKNCDYREVADPEVLCFEGKYYAYLSCRQVYVSSDLIHWEYSPIELDAPIGYAPAVTCCRGNIYLTSSICYAEKQGRIYAAKHPLGPFHTVGVPQDKNGQVIGDFLDPALFTDDDGRLYLYWGYAPLGGGIFGMEVDPERPNCGISDIFKLIDFDPNNEWEHFGEHGDVLDFGWDEGASMYKYNGKYYLQYASCGTRFPNYSIGVYMGDSPLGPFKKPATKLIGNRHGIVCGTGHGGMFTGPDGRPWQAYSVLVHRLHNFERRMGIDPVTFDENGVPTVKVSDVPQSVSSGDVGLVNAAAWKIAKVSSYMPNCNAMYAFDECPHTAWVPDIAESEPTLRINLEREFAVQAIRIIWAEQNIDRANGIDFVPVKYQVRFFDSQQQELDFMLDMSNNEQDLNIDFRSFAPVNAQYLELKILRGNAPQHYGVTDFAVFAPPRKIYS
ncbi:MAG: hypothetical protein E7052_02345 [Lentisphaerae bacterium]|nr:hypothetical protein [Lentisphaerota bacterium]